MAGQPTSARLVGVRHIREVTPGTTPAGTMHLCPAVTFKPSGGDVARVVDPTVVTDRQSSGNVPSKRNDVTVACTTSHYYKVYTPWWEEVFGGAIAAGVSYTGSNVSVVAGNILRLTSGTWANVVGDAVAVSGFTANGPLFYGTVTANAGTDLTLGADAGTLLVESAGAAVTVGYVGRFRIGSTLLTGTYELYGQGVGSVLRDTTMVSASIKWTSGSSVPQITWTGLGTSISPISAPLSNASDDPIGLYAMTYAEGFGAKLLPNGGLLYGGTPYPNIDIMDFTLMVGGVVKTAPSGGGGITPVGLYTDGVADVTLTLKIRNNHADARAMLADARNDATLASIAFPWQAPNGDLELWRFAALDPTKGLTDGLEASNERFFEFEWKGRRDVPNLHTMAERTLLYSAP